MDGAFSDIRGQHLPREPAFWCQNQRWNGRGFFICPIFSHSHFDIAFGVSLVFLLPLPGGGGAFTHALPTLLGLLLPTCS